MLKTDIDLTLGLPTENNQILSDKNNGIMHNCTDGTRRVFNLFNGLHMCSHWNRPTFLSLELVN